MKRRNELSFRSTIFDGLPCAAILMRVGGAVMLLIAALVCNSCTALKEAQQRREQRIFEERNTNSLMLRPASPSITIEHPDALYATSDHYTLTFAEDLHEHPELDSVEERESFARSALGYMESLYEAMNRLFGFQPKHKIHVTLHDLYRGTRLAATTTTIYGPQNSNGRGAQKIVKGIKMDFPLAMYEKHGVRAHELTHAFTNIYFLPVWFNEGIAVLIQTEYAQGGTHPKFESLNRYLKVNLDGVNQLESWGGHLEGGPLTQWRYRYAYTIVSELRERYGNDFYIKVFALMEADALHQKLAGKMPTGFLVYYLSKAAGEDLVPFFKDLQFTVSKVTKADILKYIEEMNN